MSRTLMFLDVEIMGNVNGEFNNQDYKELLPPRFMNRHRINENHEHVTLVYFARTSSDKIVTPCNDVSKEYKWFTRQELDNPIYGIRDNVKMYANKALEVHLLY